MVDQHSSQSQKRGEQATVRELSDNLVLIFSSLWAFFTRPKILEISGEESNGTEIFRKKIRNSGVPREVVSTFQKIATTGQFRSIGPFLLDSGPASPT